MLFLLYVIFGVSSSKSTAFFGAFYIYPMQMSTFTNGIWRNKERKKQQETNSEIERQRNTCLCNEHGIYVAEIMFKSLRNNH